MASRSIPKSEWLQFFDNFSRQHEGWWATVEVMGEDMGDQTEVKELPFQGISLDTKGSRGQMISISVGDSPEDQVTHMIDRPAFVRLEETPDRSRGGLEIESDDGEKTLVRFRTAAGSEQVEGTEGQAKVRRAGLGQRDKEEI